MCGKRGCFNRAEAQGAAVRNLVPATDAELGEQSLFPVLRYPFPGNALAEIPSFGAANFFIYQELKAWESNHPTPNFGENVPFGEGKPFSFQLGTIKVRAENRRKPAPHSAGYQDGEWLEGDRLEQR
jgi:hypothetical protein